jgi:hypothetical protein
MSLDFEELDYSETAIGALSLRRRTHLSLGVEVFEVKLGDEFLMSSLFTRGEIALAELALAGMPRGPVDVVVGGLGLGYTTRAVLAHPGVRSVVVVEALPEVIDWYRRGLVPLAAELMSDKRCEFLNADFFGLVTSRSPHARETVRCHSRGHRPLTTGRAPFDSRRVLPPRRSAAARQPTAALRCVCIVVR